MEKEEEKKALAEAKLAEEKQELKDQKLEEKKLKRTAIKKKAVAKAQNKSQAAQNVLKDFQVNDKEQMKNRKKQREQETVIAEHMIEIESSQANVPPQVRKTKKSVMELRDEEDVKLIKHNIDMIIEKEAGDNLNKPVIIPCEWRVTKLPVYEKTKGWQKKRYLRALATLNQVSKQFSFNSKYFKIYF